MRLISGLLDRVVLLLAAVAGGSVPSFVNQYQQQVGGRLDQVTLDLAPFQQIADRYHGGDMQALIQHHLNSSDPTFFAEGQAIQAMVNSAARLMEMQSALDTELPRQMGYLLMNTDRQIFDSTLQHFEPAFVLTADALIMAGCTGLIVWLLFILCWRLGGKAARSVVRPPKAVKS